MPNFQLLGHVDTFAVVAALHAKDRQELLAKGINAAGEADLPIKSLLLRGPEPLTAKTWADDVESVDRPALSKSPSMTRLLARFRKTIKASGEFGHVMVSRLDALAATPWDQEHGAYAERHHRFVIPLVTNPGATMHVAAESVHMAVGSIWWVNHLAMRTEANWGDAPRFHLVIDVEKPLPQNP